MGRLARGQWLPSAEGWNTYRYKVKNVLLSIIEGEASPTEKLWAIELFAAWKGNDIFPDAKTRARLRKGMPRKTNADLAAKKVAREKAMSLADLVSKVQQLDQPTQ